MAISVKGSGGGGLTSSDVTASSAQVLSGYTALTTDSNDEALQGTIPTYNNEHGKIIKPVYKTEEEMTTLGCAWEVIS